MNFILKYFRKKLIWRSCVFNLHFVHISPTATTLNAWTLKGVILVWLKQVLV